MSVLIKGMMMPINCQTCPFVKEVKYAATPEYEVVFDLRCGLTQMLADNPAFARNKDCPLVEIPPHGRLIDADALRAKMYHEAFETDSPMQKWDSGCWIRYKMFERMEEAAPTIIEAEEVKE